MSQADKLLDELIDNQSMSRSMNPETEQHIVINSDRYIVVPEELHKIAVQYDHNVETVTFDCPRYWDGLDMSEMHVYINYMRSDGEVGMSLAKNITIDENDSDVKHFDWTIPRGATLTSGSLSFSVCIKKPTPNGDEENHWNSERNNQLTVSPGLEYEEQKNPKQADLISDLIARMEETELAVERSGIYITTEQMNTLMATFRNIKEELSKRTETVVFNAVIKADGWSTGATPYVNTVTIIGIRDTDSPHAAPVYSNINSVAIVQEEAWNMISEGTAKTDAIVFTCFEDRPTTDIDIQVECFRTWKE